MEERLKKFALPPWEELPDLGLYMDQVVTILERAYRGLYGDERRIITPAMVNNYVKGGIIQRPAGKKYDREQIAQLMMITALKQVLSLDNMKKMLALADEGGTQTLYTAFREQYAGATKSLAGEANLSPMHCAVQSAAYQLACETALCMQKDNNS